MSPLETMLHDAQARPKYRGLILSNNWRQLVTQIIHATETKEYSPSLQSFRFHSGAMIWLHSIPTNDSALYARYGALILNAICLTGVFSPLSLDYLRTRLRNSGDKETPLHFWLNGEDAFANVQIN